MANLVADVLYWVIMVWVLALPTALVSAIIFAPYCSDDKEMDDAIYAWRMAQEDGDAPQGNAMELFHMWWAEQVKTTRM